MKNRRLSLFFIIVLLLLCCFPKGVSAQLLPEAELECQGPVEIDFIEGGGTSVINCELNNPTSGSENVELTYQSGELNVAGPDSVTVDGGESEEFQIVISSPLGQSEGIYEINVSAVVTEWNGVPVSIFGFSDEEGVQVEVLPYTSCSSSPPSSIIVNAGEEVIFSVGYDCVSNEDSNIMVSLHLLEKGSSEERMWPSGFNDMSQGGCFVQNPMGSANCNFVLTTPSNLQESWEGCLIVVDGGTDPGWSCSSAFAIPLTVNSVEVSTVPVGISVNGTILEDFGITEANQNYFLGGGVGLIALVISLISLRRRRG